ncbi:hypothetical protein ACFLYT_00565 [Nanoarchaeota archaeon]
MTRQAKIRRKSQMEIMGLLIIVILFSLGLLFTIRFMATRERTDVHETFMTKELAANMLNVILKTTSVDCKGADMAELFRDCASYPSIDCDDDGTVYTESPDMADSCYRLERDLTYIFKETLELRKTKYFFRAQIVGSQPLDWTPMQNDVNCEEDSVGDMEEFPIPTDLGDLMILLRICT